MSASPQRQDRFGSLDRRVQALVGGRAGRAWAMLVAALAVALAVASTAAPAYAHAQLVRSTPADGAVVATLPELVQLVFNEDINPLFVQIIVRDAANSRVDTATPSVVGATLSVPLPSRMPSGRVSVAYRVTSKDGHPIAGQIAFRVGPPSAPATSGAAAPPASAAGPSYDAAADSAPGQVGPGAPTTAYLVLGGASMALVALGVVLLTRGRRRPNSGDLASGQGISHA